MRLPYKIIFHGKLDFRCGGNSFRRFMSSIIVPRVETKSMCLPAFFASYPPFVQYGTILAGHPAYIAVGLGDQVTSLSNEAKSVFFRLLTTLWDNYWKFDVGHGHLTPEFVKVICVERDKAVIGEFTRSDDVELSIAPPLDRGTHSVMRDIEHIRVFMCMLWEMYYGRRIPPPDLKDFLGLAEKLARREEISWLEMLALINHSALWQPCRWVEVFTDLRMSMGVSSESSGYMIPFGGYSDPHFPPPRPVALHSALRCVNDKSVNGLIRVAVRKIFQNADWLAILPMGDAILIDVLFHGRSVPPDAHMRTPYDLYKHRLLPPIYGDECGVVKLTGDLFHHAGDQQGMNWHMEEKELSLEGDERTLTDPQRDQCEDMLLMLILEMSQIKEAMGFAFDNSDAAGEVVKVLAESLTLKETLIPTKVARLMLVSNILHNSSAPVKNASAYRTKFEATLPDIMESFKDLCRSITGGITAEALKVLSFMSMS